MRKIFYFLSLSFFAISCTKNLEIIVDGGEPKLVIEGNCPYGTQTTVKLSRTLPYNSTDAFEGVSDAIVTIKHIESGHVALLEESPVAFYKGLYSTGDFTSTDGGTYELTVEEGGKVYTARSTRLPRVEIDSIVVKKEYLTPSYPSYVIITYFTDPLEVKNYYKVNVNMYSLNRSYSFVSDDSYFNGQSYGMVFRYRGELNGSGTILIDLESITEEIHQYYFELMQLSNQMTDVSQNPNSNIVGGALGYFSASSASRESFEVEN